MGPWESLYLWAPLHSVPQMSECIHFVPFTRQVLFWAIFLQKEAYNQEIQTYCNISLQQRIRREVNPFFKNQVMCVLAIHISLLLWRSVFLGLPSILGVFFFFSFIELYELLVHFGNSSFVSYFVCKYFLPFRGFSFRLVYGFPAQGAQLCAL